MLSLSLSLCVCVCVCVCACVLYEGLGSEKHARCISKLYALLDGVFSATAVFFGWGLQGDCETLSSLERAASAQGKPRLHAALEAKMRMNLLKKSERGSFHVLIV